MTKINEVTTESGCSVNANEYDFGILDELKRLLEADADSMSESTRFKFQSQFLNLLSLVVPKNKEKGEGLNVYDDVASSFSVDSKPDTLIDQKDKLNMSKINNIAKSINEKQLVTESDRTIQRTTRVYANASDVHILVIDDDRLSATMLSRQLKKLKFRATEVHNGVDAISLLFESPDKFDLVLCDVNMPGLDGGQVLRSVLSTPQLCDLPIVMISGDNNVNRAESLVEAGAKDYLLKPIKSSTLVQLVMKLKRWRKSSGTHKNHLSKVYTISQGLLMHARVNFIDISQQRNKMKALGNAVESSGGDQSSSGGKSGSDGFPNTGNALTKVGDGTIDLFSVNSNSDDHNNLAIESVICMTASPPMLQLLGLTEDDLNSGEVDVMSFINPQDLPSLQDAILQGRLSSGNPKFNYRKLLWRWIDGAGDMVPVTGLWCPIGDGTILIESKSLLPKLLLREERERRHAAERRVVSAEQEAEKLKRKVAKQRKTDKLAEKEMESIVLGMSDFARMLTENPSVLTWRLIAENGNVDFVSDESCQRLLGYACQDLLDKCSYDTVHPDDQETARRIHSDINLSGRIRRISQNGNVVTLESRSFSWYDAGKKIIVVTEYDISEYVK